MTSLDDIWYVGKAIGLKVRMLNFGRGTCWSPGTPGAKMLNNAV